MGDIAIRMEGLGKQYRIRGKKERYGTLRDALAEAALAPFRQAGRLFRRHARGTAARSQAIWALRDFSCEIRRGEVVGFIGRNGAGKSTLLKIVSRITEPTVGFAEIRGRVGSLLEVGAGFHRELTGRENVYLNGAILGMRRAEIERKFDEIVAFAEIEKFIDTPVKHYSSGMYLRLAFAVAAHLEPEILLVDEVLAVGDARFQKKCLMKMHDVRQHGRTILFVSHSMPAVARLCDRVILLEDGCLLRDGPAQEVIGAYLNSGSGTTAVREWRDPAKAPGRQVARLRALRVRTEDGRIADAVDIRRPVAIEMEYEVLQSGYALMPHFQFFNQEGVHLFSAHDLDATWRRRPRPAGRYVSGVEIPGNLLAEGTLYVGAGLDVLGRVANDLYARLGKEFYELDAVCFRVVESHDGDSARGDYSGRMSGVIRPLLNWRTEFTPNGR